MSYAIYYNLRYPLCQEFFFLFTNKQFIVTIISVILDAATNLSAALYYYYLCVEKIVGLLLKAKKKISLSCICTKRIIEEERGVILPIPILRVWGGKNANQERERERGGWKRGLSERRERERVKKRALSRHPRLPRWLHSLYIIRCWKKVVVVAHTVEAKPAAKGEVVGIYILYAGVCVCIVEIVQQRAPAARRHFTYTTTI